MYSGLNNNLKTGKVYDFDGFAGYIVTSEYKYPFNISDYNKEENGTLVNGDVVCFYENTIVFGKEYMKVAKFISKPKRLIKK